MVGASWLQGRGDFQGRAFPIVNTFYFALIVGGKWLIFSKAYILTEVFATYLSRFPFKKIETQMNEAFQVFMSWANMQLNK